MEVTKDMFASAVEAAIGGDEIMAQVIASITEERKCR